MNALVLKARRAISGLVEPFGLSCPLGDSSDQRALSRPKCLAMAATGTLMIVSLGVVMFGAAPLAELQAQPPAVRTQTHVGPVIPLRARGPARQAPVRIPWQAYGPGEYVGRERTVHVPEYRLRVDDLLEFVYRLTREETSQPYELNVGDEIRIESVIDPKLDRDVVVVQPDGTITLHLLGQVRVTRRTFAQVRSELERLYSEFYETPPSITVTPIKVNTRLQDLINSVDSRFGTGGQSRQARVTPEGTISLPAVGSVPVQGLTLGELKRELDARYALTVEGIEVTPVLVERAERFVYVLGEVRTPGRYTLEAPTTVMQAISMAEGWNVGANLNQVVVFRRGDDWRLMATMLDIRAPLYGKDLCPADEIWVCDSDVIIVPKREILVIDEFIELVFTRGIYGVVPFQGVSINLSKASSL